MTTSDSVPRLSLRDLPLAAKLVITSFLLAVGLGYFSAMVQLHTKHSKRDGNALPTKADVVEIFSGLKEYDGKAPKSKIEELISGDPEEGWGKFNMAPAFFSKSGKAYEKDCAERGKAVVFGERDNERKALIAWINSPVDARKKAYTDDKFTLPPELTGKPITAEYLDDSKAFKISTLITDRCAKCHSEGQQTPYFESYEQLEKPITAPSPEILDGKWIRTGDIDTEKLIQSTHAHALTFAVLFGLTGLVLAFTSLPGLIRCILAPLVILAQTADISCWWLAQMDPPYGPYFALAIIGTGTLVGLGLALQITLSLFDMYRGAKGKFLALLLLAAEAAIVGGIGMKAIKPALDREKANVAARAEAEKKSEKAEKPKAAPKKAGKNDKE